MPDLKFDRVYYKKYNNSRINIENGILVLTEVKENCEVLKIDKTKYGYQKAIVQLVEPNLCDIMKVWEAQINEYLKGEGIPPIKILCVDKIYPKTIIHNPNDASFIITIKSVWINDENKPFLQLWLEQSSAIIIFSLKIIIVIKK